MRRDYDPGVFHVVDVEQQNVWSEAAVASRKHDFKRCVLINNCVLMYHMKGLC